MALRTRLRRTAIRVLIAALVVSACTTNARRSDERPDPRRRTTALGADRFGRLDFANRLRIPPLLAPHIDAKGRKVFDLTVEQGTSSFLPGRTTTTFGANGGYLGPTLRASRGDTVVVNVHNELPETTTLHWHGMHLPAVDDGGPHQTIAPGSTWSPTWQIDQPAATLWYHPHPDHRTAEQVYRGIAGLFILDDAHTAKLPLPKRYGIDDIPLILQDKRLAPDGSLDFADGAPRNDGTTVFAHTGRLGTTILVNGTYDPHVAVSERLIRFRLLNASDARVYNLGFSDDRAFALIATDGGLIERPRAMRRLQLAPGERAEIVATFRAGERVVLHSFAPDLGRNTFGAGLNGDGDSFDVLQIRAASALRAAGRLPTRLATLPPVEPSKATRTRHFVLQHSDRINGHTMNMTRVDATVVADSTEIWDVEGFIPHDFHIHGVSFRVIGYGPGPLPPQLDGWKDTVFVPPFVTVRLLVVFGPYADARHPYMFHCHILQHEDNGMMGQFVVVRPST